MRARPSSWNASASIKQDAPCSRQRHRSKVSRLRRFRPQVDVVEEIALENARSMRRRDPNPHRIDPEAIYLEFRARFKPERPHDHARYWLRHIPRSHTA